MGSDIDSEAVRMAIANCRPSRGRGLAACGEARTQRSAAAKGETGLIVANPPYGERIGAESGLPALYSELGTVLRDRFQGWQAAILTGNPPLARNLGIYAKRTHRVYQRHHRVPAAALRSERSERATSR